MPATLTPAVSRRLLVAPCLVVLSALAYQAAVHPAFQIVRVPLIDRDQRPAGHLLRVTLPDLSALRQTVPILSGHVANGPARRQRVRVLLGGVSRAELDLAPESAARFTLVLSEGTARAITSGAGGPYGIALAGDSDDWHVIALSASNTYSSLGRAIALVPHQVFPDPPMRPVVWALLAVLGTLALAFGTGASAPWLRRPHQIASAVAIGALAAAWLLPLATDRRVLVTPSIFWMAVTVAFLPAIAAAALAARRWGTALIGASARVWRRHPITCERGAILLGLVAMAIAQPVFDVLRASPEFFVARNTTAGTAVTAAALIGLGLPLLLLAIERVLRGIAPRAATAFFFFVVAALLALTIHPWLRRHPVAGPWPMAAMAAGAGALLAWLAWRVAPMRQFLAALAPAAIVVPILFFADAEISGSLTPSSSSVRTPPLSSTPPIVLIVFDEFPLHSLLDADGRIDRVRFPHFAALARGASWFRETTSVSSQTVWAVPAIVSGGYPVTPNAVPTLRYYPQNLFTLLADRYEMFVFGRFLQLCPEDRCHREVEGPGDGPLELLADVGMVWLHIVAPEPLTERLPPVVGDWLGFARAGAMRTEGGRQVRYNRLTDFNRFLAVMDGRPARLYFLHSLLPHMPFEFVPSERRYEAPDYQGRDENGAGLFRRVSAEYADALHQRHLLQVGFVDSLIGRLIARLRALGIYDQALVIVTADHGASYREAMPRRGLSARNLADIVRVPLFIKLPGQGEGTIVDGIAESVDILPTIADVLGMRLPFQVDGRSLVGEAPGRTGRTFIDRSLLRINSRDVTNWRPSSQASLARRMARFGVGSYDPLYAVPGTTALVGQPPEAFDRRAGDVQVTLWASNALADVDIAAATLPLHIRGRVLGRVTEPLAVVVNGRIVATTRSYQERGASVFSTMIPESALRPGRNEVAIFIVETTRGAFTLVSTRP